MILSGTTAVAGILGWPIGHSRSPRLHGYWLREYGVDGVYVPLAAAPDSIEAAFRGLPGLGFRGVNVTIPHKLSALTACDHVDDVAARIGAVNTIIIGDDGALSGTNTDAFGFLANLRQESDWRGPEGPAVVLGAGGAARAVCVALLDAGAPEVRITNRTDARAQALAEEFGLTPIPWADRAAALDGAALVANATSLGMTGQPPLEVSLDALPSDALVHDIVYAPLETELLAQARVRGNPIVDGLGMLLHQARPGFEAWFGVSPEVTPALRKFVLES
jgi:shikimate dehydrogenase